MTRRRPTFASRGAPWAPWTIGALLWAAVSLWDSLLPPAPGEPLVGRWLRKLAEHPVRGSLALGLLLVAVWPPRGGIRAAGEGLPEPPTNGLRGLPGPPRAVRTGLEVESRGEKG